MKDKVTAHRVYRAATVEDIDSLNLLDCFKEDETLLLRAKAMLQSGQCIAYTILDKEENPIAVFGGVYLFSKVIEVWALVDKKIDKMPKHYANATKFLIEFDFDRLRLDRMQLLIRADQSWANSWAKFLGFQKEAVMRKYGEEGMDHILFAKVRE